MTDASGRPAPRRAALFASLAILLGTLFSLGTVELVLRFLPVNEGLMAAEVNEKSPVFHFAPNRQLVWSRGWNFDLVNRLKVNNAGYVNGQDYELTDPRPLCAIVGDSYVEASMVPYAQTLHGRLAAALAPATRVYSFAASGAPLSQYLVWARQARERWKAQRLAVVVIGNDWDESLAAYKIGPGFHHYVEEAGGTLVLRRFDYRPSRWRGLVRSGALARYLFFNLQIGERLGGAWQMPSAHAQEYVGNTRADAHRSRLDRSMAVTRAFLRDLTALAGWPPDRVVFVVDGIRYPSDSAVVLNSYFVQMRSAFMTEARARGYEVVDMDEHFFASFRANKDRFEFPSDAHWNALGHQIAARALLDTMVFSRCGET